MAGLDFDRMSLVGIGFEFPLPNSVFDILLLRPPRAWITWTCFTAAVGPPRSHAPAPDTDLMPIA